MRVLYRRDILYVDNWRENVLVWLNGELPQRYYSKEACRRIERLIASLKTIIRFKRQFKTMLRSRAIEASSGSPRSTMPSEVSQSIRVVGRIIDRYPSWPVLGWDPPEYNLRFGSDFRGIGRVQEEEAEAALAAMNLAEVNELIRLRQCLCKKWFFACRTNQRSCSANCRHKLYEQTERFKTKRRKYMKQYYRLQSSGKVK